MHKKYNSLDEVNNQLNILKIERQLHYQNIFKSVDILREELTPVNLVKSSLASATSLFSGSKNIKTYAITTIASFILRRIFKK